MAQSKASNLTSADKTSGRNVCPSTKVTTGSASASATPNCVRVGPSPRTTTNNWKNTQQVTIQATGLAPPNDLESAMVVTVAAGNYTAILSGNGGGTGIGLVEVYKL